MGKSSSSAVVVKKDRWRLLVKTRHISKGNPNLGYEAVLSWRWLVLTQGWL
jgi:hypothetical protein